MLVIGPEVGLGKDLLKQIDETVRIPMVNNVDSLNLAVAAGVILFEAKRQNEQ